MNKYVCAIFVLDSFCIYAAVYPKIEYYVFLYDIFVRYMTNSNKNNSYFCTRAYNFITIGMKETLESCHITRLNFIRDQNFVIFLSHYNETEGQKDCKFWTKELGQKSHTP